MVPATVLTQSKPVSITAVRPVCVVVPKIMVTRPRHAHSIDTKTPSIGFMRPFGCPVTILNTLDPLEKAEEENVQQYVLFPLWSSGSKNPQNTNNDVAFEVKEPEFEGKSHESEVYVSPSSSAKTKKHDDKTKREAKGKSHVELSTGYRNLSAEFKDFSDNSINEVNAVDTPVLAVGQISTNSTNTFSVVGPSNTAVSQHLKNLHMWILLITLMIQICQLWKTLLILMMKKMLVQRLTLLI
nr:hypothetical protein [Tanacetum cinerariifolium]